MEINNEVNITPGLHTCVQLSTHRTIQWHDWHWVHCCSILQGFGPTTLQRIGLIGLSDIVCFLKRKKNGFIVLEPLWLMQWQGFLQGRNMPWTLGCSCHTYPPLFLAAVDSKNGAFTLPVVGGCIRKSGGTFHFSNNRRRGRYNPFELLCL